MRRPKPPPPPIVELPHPQRFRRGKGRHYVHDVVARVRVLVEGTTWPEAVIAARIGIGVATVHGWKVRGGWRRPVETSRSTRKVAVSRAGLTRRCREGFAQIEDLASGEVLRLCGAPEIDRAALNRAVALVLATRSARRPAGRDPSGAER